MKKILKLYYLFLIIPLLCVSCSSPRTEHSRIPASTNFYTSPCIESLRAFFKAKKLDVVHKSEVPEEYLEKLAPVIESLEERKISYQIVFHNEVNYGIEILPNNDSPINRFVRRIQKLFDNVKVTYFADSIVLRGASGMYVGSINLIAVNNFTMKHLDAAEFFTVLSHEARHAYRNAQYHAGIYSPYHTIQAFTNNNAIFKKLGEISYKRGFALQEIDALKHQFKKMFLFQNKEMGQDSSIFFEALQDDMATYAHLGISMSETVIPMLKKMKKMLKANDPSLEFKKGSLDRLETVILDYIYEKEGKDATGIKMPISWDGNSLYQKWLSNPNDVTIREDAAKKVQESIDQIVKDLDFFKELESIQEVVRGTSLPDRQSLIMKSAISNSHLFSVQEKASGLTRFLYDSRDILKKFPFFKNNPILENSAVYNGQSLKMFLDILNKSKIEKLPTGGFKVVWRSHALSPQKLTFIFSENGTIKEVIKSFF